MNKKNDLPTSSSTPANGSLWGGRFQEPTDAFVERFNASVSFDRRLYAQDINGSIAHAEMLAATHVLTDEEALQITTGLLAIKSDIEAGDFIWLQAREDVHMNIEARLTEKIGITGKKLHTGRSRNDQVATDIRLYLRGQIDLICAQLTRLQQGLVTLAEREAHTGGREAECAGGEDGQRAWGDVHGSRRVRLGLQQPVPPQLRHHAPWRTRRTSTHSPLLHTWSR